MKREEHEVAAVVCGMNAVLAIRTYLSNGNTRPLVLAYEKGKIPESDVDFLKSAAEFTVGTLIEFDGPFSDKDLTQQIAKDLSPESWVLLDETSVVLGNLDECFAYANTAPGFAMARFRHPSSIDNRHPDIVGKDGLCRTSPLFFHGEANKRILEDLSKVEAPDLSSALSILYESNPSWHEGFVDFSIRNWVDDVEKYDPDTSPSGKVACFSEKALKAWSSTANIPRAPFESDDTPSELPDDGAVDAVFVIGTGSVDNNEELRYALRNLEKHCPFVRDVYICGVCPPWVDRSVVKHLNWPDRFRHAKDANIIDKLRHACEHRGIAKRILFCSDDQFQTRVCSWADFDPMYLRRYNTGDRWYDDKHRVWHSRLKKTLERDVQRRKACGQDQRNVFYYQPHVWMQIDRDRFVDYARWCNYEDRDDTIIASGYFNFIDAKGVPDHDHVFLGASEKSVPKATHVAYHDGSEKAAMAILRKLFPERSRFETVEPARHPVAEEQRRPVARRPESPEANLPEVMRVMKRIREEPVWNALLGEVSRAEELRLFGVKGWDVVWNDIVRRWKESTSDGKIVEPVKEGRSKEAADIVSAYMSDPEKMRTVRFGITAARRSSNVLSFGRQNPRPAPESVTRPLRDKIRLSLGNRAKKLI